MLTELHQNHTHWHSNCYLNCACDLFSRFNHYLMKKIFLLLCSLVLHVISTLTAQTFTWISGSQLPNQPGIYGQIGVPSASTTPGARMRAVGWTDSIGNFWLFGGYGRDVKDSVVLLNDLWHFNVLTKQWKWVAGAKVASQSTVYGTKGLASPSNFPGSRQSAASWVDESGNFWMFGGGGLDINGTYGNLNDLWKYNPANNLWTWMGGSTLTNSPGTYNSLGIPSTTNMPCSRVAPIAVYESGMVWLFGGFGLSPSGNMGFLNDLCRYNISTNEWTWMKGDIIADVSGVYGSLNTGAPSNKPGGRVHPSAWYSNGALFVLGGRGMAESETFGYLNDLWKYDIATNEWIWLKGSNFKNQNGIYGTQGIVTGTTLPGAREGSAHWKDTLGNFWIYGGHGLSDSSAGQLSDLWKYNTFSNVWTWMKGSSKEYAAGNYGAIGVASPLNFPGPRYTPVSWVDRQVHFWFFGGSGLMNDLWRIHTSTLTVPEDVGIDEKSHCQPIVQIIPNPNNGTFMIQYNGPLENAYVEIYDLVGELLIKNPIEKELPVDSQLSKGLYIYKVIAKMKVLKSGKIVVE